MWVKGVETKLRELNFPEPGCVHQPKNSLNPPLSVLMEVSLHGYDLLKHGPLVMKLLSSPSRLPTG